MSDFKFISADSHVVEPAELFVERIDKEFRDRAPRIENRGELGDWYVIDGIPPFPVGLEGASMEDKIADGTVNKAVGKRHADTRPGAWDAAARLADQDLDNVGAEVVYPGNIGIYLPNVENGPYQLACARVYNDWLAELCAAAPSRLRGAGFLPLAAEPDEVIAEAKRIADLGLASVLLPAKLENDSYRNPAFAGLFAALNDISLPVALHSGTGTGPSFAVKVKSVGAGLALVQQIFGTAMNALADLIWSGVPQQYPELNFVIVEGGIGWIASLLRKMDHWWHDHHSWMTPRLEEPPSHYWGRQFYATFEDDRAGILTRDLIGVDRLMWGSDYPHTEGTFPNSEKQIEADLGDISEKERRMITRDNAAALYGL